MEKELFVILRKTDKTGTRRYVQLFEIRDGQFCDITEAIACLIGNKSKRIKIPSTNSERTCLVLNGCGFDVMADVCMKLNKIYETANIKYDYRLL